MRDSLTSDNMNDVVKMSDRLAELNLAESSLRTVHRIGPLNRQITIGRTELI